MSIKQTAEWGWGEWGEGQVRRWFQEQGWFVIPTSAIENGGAPKLIGLLAAHVLPDLQTARAGEMRWVEVKTKTAPVLYQITRTWRHGIDLRLWDEYLKVQAETGLPGDLAIVQVRPGPAAEPNPTLLVASFDALANEGQVGNTSDGPRIFWDVSRFRRWVINDCQIPPIPSLRKVVHPWERPSKTGEIPQMRSDEDDDPPPEMFLF